MAKEVGVKDKTGAATEPVCLTCHPSTHAELACILPDRQPWSPAGTLFSTTSHILTAMASGGYAGCRAMTGGAALLAAAAPARRSVVASRAVELRHQQLYARCAGRHPPPTAPACPLQVGAGVLAMPLSLGNLGWVAGPIAIILFYLVSVLAARLLASVYEVDGVQHPRYFEAVRHILGASRAFACRCLVVGTGALLALECTPASAGCKR